jgi:hypothetical protein
MTTAPIESPFVNAPAAPTETTAREQAGERVEPRSSRRHLLWLALICLLGVTLRFSFMHRPLLWGDDAYTVYRTHADYQAMLDILQYDGFTPLHYELYWLIGRVAGKPRQVTITSGPRAGEVVTQYDGLTPHIVRTSCGRCRRSSAP